ncbi:unnamed protein product [Rotaria socialis]|uniref:Caspase family p20 domain-containing protein n=1 Tax=Rotaria socialis TaxID=392032 RepID=A0A820CFQ9_9BILA|nr:unnamed protein product [Rotaria socialis]CAF3441792.1 unnamed protein product [Rotaria socialis]CAF3652454.1 unnamed protein product [Rotaria socialis]CAF4220682.1 unnamed protein product [Rotaria socialis]CAF4393670.1 unnamed protein product [Rotaria socialis]
MASAALLSKKRALVLGIDQYADKASTLQICVVDAIDLGKALRDIKFEVSQETNCSYTRFKEMIDDFMRKIQNGDFIVFYFAGHGLQSDDKNYLLSSDYCYDHSIDEKSYLSKNAANAQNILHQINAKRPRYIIFILDCCRTKQIRGNPTSSLASMNPTSETLLVYSCGAGQGALDDAQIGRNSHISVNAKWTQNGVTIAGGDGGGDATNQLYCPEGLFVDDNQTVVIADFYNHRVVQWKKGNTTNGQVVAGDKGQGNGLNQLDRPNNVLVDKETDNLIICDPAN